MAHVMTHGQALRREDEYAERTDVHRVDEGLQHQRYGGMHIGADFLGWLVSTGMAVILTSILVAAGGAVAVTTIHQPAQLNSQTVATVGLVSGILLLLVLSISYYVGGYVAGRMSRFDGARQGFGVWIVGLVIMIALGAVGAALGAKYNVLQQLNLPHLPVKAGSFTRGGLITSILSLLMTLGAAMLGGKAGERYHRKIDEAGTV